ncbi:hypothetical protein RUM44_013461 [Polyplax serrata]|uniref:Uncharacterized protein n=1 Tax=Polyplax serrata TaxID=468196 RepID=A0ABR1BE87_POLSC
MMIARAVTVCASHDDFRVSAFGEYSYRFSQYDRLEWYHQPDFFLKMDHVAVDRWTQYYVDYFNGFARHVDHMRFLTVCTTAV